MHLEQLLWIRENIISYYKRFETVIHFALKLLLGMFMFNLINGIGLFRPEFAPFFTPPFDFPIFLLLSLLFAVLPPTAGNALLILTVLAQTSSSIEVAVFIFLLLLCVLAFYGRISPKKSYLIIIMIIAHRLNMHYAVALFAGLYLGITSMIPLAIGTCISSFLPFFSGLANAHVTPEKFDIMEMPATFMSTYAEIFKHMSSNLDWVIWAFVFAMVVLAVHVVSRLSIPFSKDIAVGTGAIVAIFGLAVAGGISGVSIPMGNVLVGLFFSILLVELLRFFDSILDYQRTERVQFEDNENYYYVKVVPKIVGRHPGEARLDAYDDDSDDEPVQNPITTWINNLIGKFSGNAHDTAPTPKDASRNTTTPPRGSSRNTEPPRGTRNATAPQRPVSRSTGTPPQRGTRSTDTSAKPASRNSETRAYSHIGSDGIPVRRPADPSVRRPAAKPELPPISAIFDDETNNDK